MKGQFLRTLHRYVGIITAPFLVVQTVSGLLLGFGVYRQPGASRAAPQELILPGSWNALLVKAHFEAGWIGDAYHLLLGAGIVWMSLSGWLMFLNARRMRKKLEAAKGAPSGTEAGAR